MSAVSVLVLWPAEPSSGAVPAIDRLEVSCEACILVDERGRALFSRAERRELPMASTTKMMTALLTIEEVGLDERVEISTGAAATAGGGMPLVAGQEWSAGSLLHALLMASSNDAAVALAEHAAGSEPAFVGLMNERAAAMGLAGTRFTTAHGLDMAGHHSTAADLAELGRALLDVPALAAIVADTEATVEGPDGDVLVQNRNLLLERYPAADGIKTGYTLGAGNVLVASARRGGRHLIAVAMRADDPFEDARRMFDAGFAAPRRRVLVDDGAELGSLVFDPAGSVGIAAARPVRGVTDAATLATVFEPSPEISLPIESGDVVGRLLLVDGDDVVARVDARATGSLSPDEQVWGARVLATLLGWGHWLLEWAL